MGGGVRKIEMHWRCSACGNENLGRFKTCQRCGDPKDAGERFEMPSDTANAASVTDPSLLRLANAGPDWRCRYCNSDQRALDGTCAQCGAAQPEGVSVRARAGAPRSVGRAGRPPWTAWIQARPLVVLAAALVMATVMVCGVSAFWRFAARDPAPPASMLMAAERAPRMGIARVTGVAWRRVVHIDRWHVVEREGFAEDRPAAAFDVRSLGRRHHHDEQVLDHYETETYDEQVPFQDTETYTEQVSCGEDCTETPETCSETCTSDDNGFATCSTSCSGGGRSCTPRYCSETRTRSVTRYRSESRTRQVPRYRAEPRHAEAFHWRVWDWTHDRDVVLSGTSDPPRWPDEAQLAPAAALGEAEREREQREDEYHADVRDDTGATHRVDVASAEELARYTPDSAWRVAVWPSGQVRVLSRVGETTDGGSSGQGT